MIVYPVQTGGFVVYLPPSFLPVLLVALGLAAAVFVSRHRPK